MSNLLFIVELVLVIAGFWLLFAPTSGLDERLYGLMCICGAFFVAALGAASECVA